MSCLLYPLSYIAVVDMVAFDAGTHEQQSCRAPVWFEPQPQAPNTDQDLGNDERGGRSSEYGAGKARHVLSAVSVRVRVRWPPEVCCRP